VITLAAAAIVAGAVIYAAQLLCTELAAGRKARGRERALTLLDTLAPAIAAADADPRAVLVWQPIARAARALFPDEAAAIDSAIGSTFPYSAERLQAAHAKWTADWLAWEGTHDAEYKRRAAAAQEELARSASPAARAALDAIEREKLDLYQRRYEEYIRVAKALQGVQI
jgi:hypothetical protein